MSAIKKELVKATDLETKRGEDHTAFAGRLILAVGELNDKAWGELSDAAQDWFNDAVDAKNAKKKELPGFPDEPSAELEPEKATTRRGRTEAKEEAKPADESALKVGQRVKITNKRGKVFEGEVIELDKSVVVVKGADGEDEIDRDRIDSVEIFHGDAAAAEAGDGPADPEIKKGMVVTVVTKRGKEATGKIVELDDEVIILDVDGKDTEFDRDRVETIKPMDTEKAEAPKSGRRGAAKDDGKDAESEKPKRSSNPAGVSVGGRIREIMCEDMGITQEAVSKIMKKDGLEFRDTSLNMIYKDTAAVIALLKANKKLK